jgi:hypothetical protein
MAPFESLPDRAVGFGPDELAGLTRELDKSLPDAAAHAAALAGFFEANAEVLIAQSATTPTAQNSIN